MGLPRCLRPMLPVLASIPLLLGSGSCLITDPILPLDETTNQAPTFNPKPNPDPDQDFHIPSGSTQLVTFRAQAQDDRTSLQDLVYLWQLDGTTVANGSDIPDYTTSGSLLGNGTHTLTVRVSDTGPAPQGFVAATWNIVIP